VYHGDSPAAVAPPSGPTGCVYVVVPRVGICEESSARWSATLPTERASGHISLATSDLFPHRTEVGRVLSIALHPPNAARELASPVRHPRNRLVHIVQQSFTQVQVSVPTPVSFLVLRKS
jgi:hypothetical protein